MKPVIFSGPSLDVKQASKRIDAVWLPPAGHGDVLDAITHLSPTAIGLIDGVWNGQTVWYKEIMLALDMGIPVYGASHLGAIRAVELESCGMRGVGKIYDLLEKQDFLDYGEIAATWKHAGDTWMRTSEPMTNVRATLASAQQHGVLGTESCLQMESLAASIFYQDRTWERLINECSELFSPQLSKAFSTWLSRGYVDQQSLDALDLIECLHSPELPKPMESTTSWRTSTMTLSVQDRYTAVHRSKGRVSRTEIVDHAALHLPDYHEINFNALNRKLVMLLAEELGVKSSPELEKIEEERFRRRRKLKEDHEFTQWLADNDLDENEFRSLMAERAICHYLHRWMMLVKQPYAKNTKAILEEMKLRGDFPEVADKAAAKARLIREKSGNVDQMEAPDVTALFREHLQNSGIPWEYDYRVVVPEYGLSLAAFHWELHKSGLVREYMHNLIMGIDENLNE